MSQTNQNRQLKSFAELKAAARGHLDGNYSKSVLITISYLMCTFFISMIATGSGATSSSIQAILLLVLSVICSCFLVLLKAGLFHFFIKTCCNVQTDVKDVFCAFNINGKRNFIYSLVIVLIQNLCLVPGEYFLVKYTMGGNVSDINYLSTTIISFVIGIIVYIFTEICFSQVLFLMFDFPDKNVRELIQLSLYLIKGQKVRYLLLHLTFLPLEFLGSISCFIGLLWVLPYKYSTLACYYLDLTKHAEDQ